MMKFSRSLFSLVFVLLLSACQKNSNIGPIVLVGEVEGECPEIVVMSSTQDKMFDYLYPEVQDSVKGEVAKFELCIDSISDFVDLAVSVGEDVFGARVNVCDTMRMKFTPQGEGHYSVEYQGKTERESKIWTDWYDVYGYWGQYNIRPDRDPNMTFDDSMNKILEKDSIFREKHKGELDEYYLHRSDLMLSFIKAVLLEYHFDDQGVEYREQPEYQALFKDCDLEDPLLVSCGLINRWAAVQMYGMGDDDISRNINFMKAYQGKILNKTASRAIANRIANELIFNPKSFTDAKVEEYLSQIESFAPHCSDIVNSCRVARENEKKVTPGNAVPDVKLLSPDGTETSLYTLFGKVLYIDIWATWCAPCCMEIPYMEKLVERFKNQENIAFVSISDDKTAEPWQEKLERDKPAWPQYRIDPEGEEKFMKSLNINSIPRFILLDKEGKIIEIDAPRPSDEKIDDFLNKAIQ